MTTRALLLFGLGTLGVWCGTDPGGELTRKERTAARKAYVAKCAKCHQFYDPTRYAPADWREWFDKMARKSKLKEGQQELLARYLDAYRAGRLAGKPEQPPPE